MVSWPAHHLVTPYVTCPHDGERYDPDNALEVSRHLDCQLRALLERRDPEVYGLGKR